MRNYALATVVTAALLIAVAPAHADSMSDALLAYLNAERGGIKEGDLLDTCPCTVVGVGQQDATSKLVVIATQDGSWWRFTCNPLDTGEWLCGMANLLTGTGAIVR